VILADFDNVGRLVPSSRMDAFLVVQGKDLVSRPDFGAKVLAREFPALTQEFSMEVSGPKIRLADIPTRRQECGVKRPDGTFRTGCRLRR
jgi:hypothetical protein